MDPVEFFRSLDGTREHPPFVNLNGACVSKLIVDEVSAVIARCGGITLRNVLVIGTSPAVEW